MSVSVVRIFSYMSPLAYKWLLVIFHFLFPISTGCKENRLNCIELISNIFSPKKVSLVLVGVEEIPERMALMVKIKYKMIYGVLSHHFSPFFFFPHTGKSGITAHAVLVNGSISNDLLIPPSIAGTVCL